MIENMFENYSIFMILLFYLIGSIPFAVLISKMFSLPDPRSFGSNNPGATNVMRSGNKVAGVLTFLFDLLKAYIPIHVLKIYGFEMILLCLLSFAIIVGHLYSLFLNFKGGKGVATSYGALLGIDIMAGLYAMLVWLITFILFRISGLSAIISFLLLPSIIYVLELNYLILIFSFIITLLILFSHRRNIVDFILKKT